MKVLIFTLLFAFVAFNKAQEPTPPAATLGPPLVATPPPDVDEDDEGSADGGFTCYEGLNANATVLECDTGELESACQTKFEIQQDADGTETFKNIIRVCTTLSSCMIQAAENNRKCYPGENNVRLCFFCCTTSNCNNFDDVPPRPTAST